MSANCLQRSTKLFAIVVHISITLTLIFWRNTTVYSNPIPDEVMEYGSYETGEYTQDKMIIEEIIRYSQYSNELESCNTDPNQYSDLSEFTAKNIDEIESSYVRNEEICNSLDLESYECYEDCIYYLSPLTLLLENDTDSKLMSVLNWYQMGGSPTGWFDTGNPDMCAYQDGTYCFTPIQISDVGFMAMNLQEHGCCLPGTCRGEDAVKVLQQNQYCYQGYNLTYNVLMFGGFLNITNICEPLPRDLSSAGFIIVTLIFIIFVICIITASVTTQHMTETIYKYENSFSDDRDIEISGNYDRYPDNKTNKTDNIIQLKLDNKFENPNLKSENVFDNNWFLYCFSLQNLWKIFIRRRPADKSDFNFLDGIRVASMSWVIWGHVYVLFLMSSPSNQAVMMPFDANAKQYPYVFTQFYMMFAEYGFYSVDSFFYLSGFLGAFALTRQLKKYGNKAIKLCYIWIPLSYLNRILRIFPMMAFILFVQWYISDQLPYGYHVSSRDMNNELCKDTWYSILLFYNNLGDMDDLGCMGHLWYIQCDMQMFLILPFIILIFKFNKICGLISSLIPTLICIGIRIYYAIHYRFSANQLYPAFETINNGDQQQQYFKPWVRMAPYFVGTFTLLLILVLKDKQFQIKSRFKFLFIMSLSCFIMCCLVFWPYGDVQNAPKERWGLISNQIYYALSRPFWGVALGLLSFGLVFKSSYLSSIIGTLLSGEIYQPLSKLTYTMYLIHWMILNWFFADLNMSTYYEFWWILCIFFAIWFITMILTFILWFVIEQPMANLVSLFMKFLIKTGGNKNQKQNKNSMDSELANIIKKNKNKNKKINNNFGYNIIDRLLIEGNGANRTNRTLSHGYNNNAISGDYESFVDDHDNNEYSSIKSN